jgi:hypothetical protein
VSGPARGPAIDFWKALSSVAQISKALRKVAAEMHGRIEDVAP